VAWLWRQTFLRATVILVAGSNFAWSAMILALIFRTKDLGASPAVIGLILGLIGGGAILGSFAAPSIQRRVAPSLVVIGSFSICGRDVRGCCRSCSNAERA
jgi:hypothetical protein